MKNRLCEKTASWGGFFMFRNGTGLSQQFACDKTPASAISSVFFRSVFFRNAVAQKADGNRELIATSRRFFIAVFHRPICAVALPTTSTLATGSTAFVNGVSVFGDPGMATALLDRITLDRITLDRITHYHAPQPAMIRPTSNSRKSTSDQPG
ncbi:MAG: hypothetical protein WBI41_01285 [Azovibrio sp.]|uniref:hypothetical protein n=1 Tax=Azovibrio sp. TaxID=1872673 RepID=UPI003C780C62